MATKLSTAEAFYVESHWGKKDVKDIAKDLGRSVKTVLAYVAKLEEAGRQPEAKRPEPSAVEQAGYDPVNLKKGVTSATSTSTAKADESRKRTGRNEEFFNSRAKNAIHVIDPNRPVQ
jgi:predicted transcriptional regulator